MVEKRRFVTDEEIKAVRRLRRGKMSIVEIAAELGLSKSTVGRAVADMKTDRRAAANKARAGVAPSWLDKAKRLRKSGKSYPQIAEELDVAQSSVFRALKKFWRRAPTDPG